MCSIRVCRSLKKAPVLGAASAREASSLSNACTKNSKNVPFVVIAVHRSQGYTIEPMAVEDYHFLGFGGFPAGWVNRKKKVDMSFYNTRNVLQQQPKKTPFKVETKVTKTDTFDYDITLTSTLGFDNTKTNLRIQYVLVEDKVGPL